MLSIKRALYFFGRMAFCLSALGAFYLAMAFTFGLISVNKEFRTDEGSIEIFVVNNGVHASLILPARNEYKNWQTTFSPENTQAPSLSALHDYVQIDWGSKTFYTSVSKWKKLRPGTAFKSLMFDKGLFKVTYVSLPKPDAMVKSIKLTSKQYQDLVNSIEKDIALTSEKSAKPVNLNNNDETDAFYEAKNYYTPLRTCNQWTRTQLSHAQVKVPAWAPFAQTIFWHLN